MTTLFDSDSRPAQYDHEKRVEHFPTLQEAIARSTSRSTITDEHGRIVWQSGKHVDLPIPPTR